ncbi:hypothetical protein [Streptomyces sp. NPDC048269]
MLDLDVVGGRIEYVEILGLPPIRRASPRPPGGAEAEHPDL